MNRREIWVEIRKTIKRVLNKGYYPPTDIKIPYKILGSVYGGWAVPASLKRRCIVYSFGIGDDITFDLELIEKFNVHVFAFDPTPKSIRWISCQKLPDNFVFVPVGLATWDGNAVFLPPPNPEFVSYRMVDSRVDMTADSHLKQYPVKRLITIMKELEHTRIDVLKMDIEGAEYDVIDDLLSHNLCPKVLLVEFHHRWPEIGVQKTQKTIQMLRERGYKLFYVSDRDEFGFVLIGANN